MGRAASLLLLTLAGVLTPAPASAQERATKTWSSANGLYSIRFVIEGDEKCRVEVLKGAEKAWALPRCVGTIDDFYFVDDGGQRFWVIRTLPQTPPEQAPSKKFPRKVAKSPHFRAVVAQLYAADGKVLKSHRLEQFLASHRVGLLRQLGNHFKWVEGVAGVPGKAPRVTDRNVVEFETVAQKTHTLKFK